ncbi:MAG: glycosyltransferase family 9 protein [Kiritimatiellae bacterium]|nr:glycosyltransferase family 9 protein [Kiritimatiellia bacterium]
MTRIAYFPHDRLGDALVDIGQLPVLRRFYAPCEITAFCTEANRELFECLAWCDRSEVYGEEAWTAEQGAAFGEFEAAFNTRHDRDAFERCAALRAKARYGYETCEVTEEECRKGYTAYLPLSMWDDETLRWKTGVCEQGAALVRLVEPGFHIDFPRLGEGDFRVDFPEDKEPWQGGKTALFSPGAGAEEKRWPMERYFALARGGRAAGWNIVFQTGPCERELGREAASAGFAVSDTPTLARMAGQMRLARCVVGNDTGPMHLAAMLGVPTVTLYFHGSEGTWFPYGSDERTDHVALSPGCARARCLEHCREAVSCGRIITLETVEEALKRVCGEGQN